MSELHRRSDHALTRDAERLVGGPCLPVAQVRLTEVLDGDVDARSAG